MSSPRLVRSRMRRIVNGDGAGDYSTASTAMVAVDGTDLVADLDRCQVDDVVRLRLLVHHSNTGANVLVVNFYSTNRTAYLDAGASASGVDGVWRVPSTTTPRSDLAEFDYTLVADDIVDGEIQIVPHYRTTAGTETIYNSAGEPLPQFTIENLGPQQEA